MATMMSDPYLMSKLADFGLHSYVGHTSGPSGVYSFIKQSAYTNTPFWMTEFGVWCSVCMAAGGDGSWANARAIASALHQPSGQRRLSRTHLRSLRQRVR